jgi:uncharacterized protein DUF3300
MKKLFVVLMALLVALPPAQAQERQAYSQAELDQMLAPIALYPDALLSQVLMAATYPLEVVEAARWSRAHPGLLGDEAVRAVQDREWDPSVKSLLAFPNLLSRMDEKLEWTKQLGDAFLAQEQHVMDTVQDLRRKAKAAGQLAPDERVRIVEDGSTIVIEAANPRVVYVPYYDPWVVYGPWWWSAYPPIGWAPWPGYVVYRPGFWWGVGVTISSGFFFGSVSWPHRHVVVTHANNYYLRPSVIRRDVMVRPIAPGRWQHDPSHRRGIVYRSPEVQRRFAADAQWQRNAPRPAAVAPAPRRIERTETRPAPPREERRENRREERRDDRRGQAMPPAFRASSPPARAEAPRALRPVPEGQKAQPRAETPRAVQTLMGVHQSQPRGEARQQMRAEPHARGNGGERGGGWRKQNGRD